jgi:hypothetical protein
MTLMSRLVFIAALAAIAGIAASQAHAQSATGRALFAYPMQGQTPEQENADRAACHDWAVQQSGFDPTNVPIPQSGGGVLAGVPINARPGPTGSGRGIGSNGGGFGSAMTSAEIRRQNELYDAYLRAGQVCLEARGYRVTR